MRICDIRPIPKQILAVIQQADEQNFPQPNGHVRFYSYLTTARRELIKVTVAVKHIRKKWFCKQVAIHGLYSSKCYVKDIEYCGYFGMGFRVGWYDEGLQPHRKWYECGWCWAADKYYDPSCPTLNLQFVGTLPEFRYSAFEYYRGADILGYLRLYTAYPQIEYLMKFGLDDIAQNVTILKRCGKDKNFCKWLIKNRAEIAGNYHYIPVIMEAYKSGRPLADLQRYYEVKKSLQRTANYAAVKELFKDRNLEDLCRYLTAQKANASSYADYVKACVYLGLDMSLERNLLPHEFRRWHDIRIDEYRTAMTIASENKRKEFYARFEAITEKYAALQHNKRSAFVAIIARSPADLITEGNALHYCVGRMNYDQRIVREESLIFFIRTRECPDTPFVTVEYSPSRKAVLQCYGDYDSKPDDTVLHYVNDVWLPYANKTLKKLAA